MPGLAPDPGSVAETLAMRLTNTNRTITVPYGSEAGRFQKAGIPTVLCGPGDIAQAHQPDEWIEESEIARCEASCGGSGGSSADRRTPSLAIRGAMAYAPVPKRLGTAGKRMPSSDPDLSGLWLSPFVVMSRMPILFYESLNPDPRGRNETNRMVVEKLAAAQEGLLAAQVAFGRAVAENMAALAFGQPLRATARKTAQAMVRAGLAPAARRGVKANAKRLSKR